MEKAPRVTGGLSLCSASGSHSTVPVRLVVELDAELYGRLRLRVALTEDPILYQRDAGSPCEAEHQDPPGHAFEEAGMAGGITKL